MKLSEFSILCTAERQTFSLWNRTDVAWERVCVPELFERQAQVTPDAVACHDTRGSLTYAQLNCRANQLAHRLQSEGVGPEVRVALFVERSCDFIVGLMGIFKAGGCVVPLDPQYPSAYLQRIMDDARPQSIVTSAELEERIAGNAASTLRVDDPALAQQPQKNTLSGLQPEHLAHVMYTSGSTGQPKGVMVPHWQITNWLHALWERMPFTADDMVAQKTSAAFAVSVKELLAGLLAGVPQVLLPDEVVKDTAAFAAALEQWRVTRLNIVPSHLQSLLSHLGDDTRALASLKYCVTAGEPLTQALRTEVRQKLPWVRLWNNYGCTELNDVTYCDAQEQGNAGAFASIGRPISNTRVFVLDSMLRQAPVGVMGELCVESIGMARGYWQQPDLTAERFIPNPFSTRPGARLYRTGDMVRYLSDGSLEYLGRRDFEIKIRGHRIDVRQVERALKEHPAIEQTVVSAWPRNSVSARLVAYVVMAKSEALSADVLRKYLSERLPAYMVPSLYVALDAFPRLPNGKLNRMALPAPDTALIQTSDYVAPETETEKQLCDIWKSLLGLERVGVLDNFFSIGGDSISSAKVAAQAKRFGIPLATRQLFEHQTIRELAVHALARHGQEAREKTGGAQMLTPAHHRFLSEVGMQDAHRFNHSVLLRPPAELTEAALRTIADALYLRHDVLRLRWSLTDEGWQAAYLPFDACMVENSVAVEHLQGNTEEERRICIEQIDQRTRIGLSAGGVLMRMVHLKADGGESRLLVVLHRIVADETSLRILLRDIELAWRQYRLGQAIHLPPENSSYREWSDFLHSEMKQDSLLQEKDYWLQQLNAATDTLPAIPAAATGDIRPREKTARVVLSRAYTAAMLKDCPEAFGAGIEALLLAALMSSLHRWLAIADIRVRMETDGREKAGDRLDFGETAGCFTVAYPVALHCSDPESPALLVEEIRAALDGVPGRGIGFGLLKYSARDEAIVEADEGCRDDILFSYAGVRDMEFVTGSAFQRDGNPLHSGAHPHDSERRALSLHAEVIDGRMSLSLGYCEARFSATLMEKLAADLRTALQALIERGHASIAQSYTPVSHVLSDSLKTDSVCRYHPLPANRHWYFTSRTKDLHAWGSCIGLQFSDANDHTASVAQTTAYLQKVHAGLRLQLIRENETWFERVADAGSVEIFHVEDLSSLPESQKETGFDRKFSACRDSIDLSESLFKVVYFKMGEQRQDRIALVMHHLAVDQYSADILIRDFDEFLSAIENGYPLAPRPADDSISEWAKAQRQWANSERAESALKYWLQHDFSSFGKLPVDFEHAAEANSIDSSNVVTRKLSVEDSDAFLAFTKGSGSFSMLDALLTATVEGFEHWSGKRALCVELVDSGRDSVMQEMDVSGTLGWLNEFVPIFIDLGRIAKGKESLQAASRSIVRCMKHGKGFNALKYHSDDPSVRRKLAGVIEAEVAINFIPPTLGQSSRKPPDCGGMAFSRWEPMDGGKRERVHLLGCEIAFDDGQLRFSWNFSRNVYRQSTVERLANACVAELTALVRMMSEQQNDNESDMCAA